MDAYEENVLQDLNEWQRKMQRRPSVMNRITAKVQYKMNSLLPEKVHKAITATIKQLTRAVLFGAKYTTGKSKTDGSLEVREAAVLKSIEFYKKTAAVEGGLTGAGGILLGLADFPLLITLKMKLLFDIAATYGCSVKDYRERVYILYIFQLAFSSQKKKNEVFRKILNWEEEYKLLPDDIHQFDWRTFQQEYRDYIDLAKLAQLVPVIGAPVGAVVNYRLIKKLGITAMNAYRLRWARSKGLLE
jgi:hypothetical protein